MAANDGLDGLFFEDDSQNGTGAPADVRAPGDSHENKETVKIGTTTTYAIVSRNMPVSYYKNPDRAAAFTVKQAREDARAGKAPATFVDACIMRVGKQATINGLATVQMGNDTSREVMRHVRSERGYALVYLGADAYGLGNMGVFDITVSIVEFVMQLDKVAPNVHVHYDVNAKTFEPELWKDKTLLQVLAMPEHVADKCKEFKQTAEGKDSSLSTITFNKPGGAGVLCEMRMHVKLPGQARTALLPMDVDECIALYLSGPEQDQMDGAMTPCVDMIKKHVGLWACGATAVACLPTRMMQASRNVAGAFPARASSRACLTVKAAARSGFL